MAIDLFCYTSHPKDEMEKYIESFSIANADTLPGKFSVSAVREANAIQRETASEHGLAARTIFLISVNDKSAAGQVSMLAELLRTSLRPETLVVLWENERPI